MVCLDSDILIDFLNKEKGAVARIQSLRKNKAKLTTTSINSFEILKGFEALNNKEKLETAMRFINSFKILGFNLDSSRKAAKIFNDLKSRGEMIELPDVMIASICISNEEPLLTGNKKHFERISELRFERV